VDLIPSISSPFSIVFSTSLVKAPRKRLVGIEVLELLRTNSSGG